MWALIPENPERWCKCSATALAALGLLYTEVYQRDEGGKWLNDGWLWFSVDMRAASLLVFWKRSGILLFRLNLSSSVEIFRQWPKWHQDLIWASSSTAAQLVGARALFFFFFFLFVSLLSSLEIKPEVRRKVILPTNKVHIHHRTRMKKKGILKKMKCTKKRRGTTVYNTFCLS